MGITRRVFLRDGALAMVGTSAVPAFLTRSVFADAAAARSKGKRLVVIFQRGAADGLNVVVPYAEKNYYAMRPTIAIPQNQVIDLDGFFGLHPSMASFEGLYREGHLAIVPAAGSPDSTRSHFDALVLLRRPGVVPVVVRGREFRLTGEKNHSVCLCTLWVAARPRPAVPKRHPG
jgi:uncharacterized protein (DUF1501 family)